MIKLEIEGEHGPPMPERTVVFAFRRHKQAGSTRSVEQIAYLTAREPAGPFDEALYPVKVDGVAKIVEVRPREFEKLGFLVVVKN